MSSASIVTSYGIPPSAGTPRAIVLGNGLFLEPVLAFATAVLTFAPRPAATPIVSWTLSNANVSLVPPANSFAPPAPAGGVTLSGIAYGPTTLTAQYGSSSTQSVALPVFYYPSADIGCDFRAEAGAAFDPGANPGTVAARDDVYETAPVAANDGLNPCAYGTGYETAAGTPTIVHFPFGATIVTDGTDASRPLPSGVRSADAFPFAPATLWRDDFTAISATALLADLSPCGAATECATIPGRVLFFKTAGGRIVKFDAFTYDEADGVGLLGIYEVTGAGGVFPY